jgi:hypothetical protein
MVVSIPFLAIIFQLNVLDIMFKKNYNEIYTQLKESINFLKVGISSDIVQARKWRNNSIYNLNNIINSPGVDIFYNSFKDKPVICVSAGPSLDKKY